MEYNWEKLKGEENDSYNVFIWLDYFSLCDNLHE